MVSGETPLILLVEDDPRFVDAIEYYLTHRGYRVEKAASGTEGLELFARLKPDLILSDNALPHLMGYEMVAQIRRSDGGEEVPVIMMSAFAPMVGPEDNDELIVDHFLTKPFLLTELERRIEQLLDTSSEAGARRLEERRQRILRWCDPPSQPQIRTRTPPPSSVEVEERLRTEMDLVVEHIRTHGLGAAEAVLSAPPPPDPVEELAEQKTAPPAPPGPEEHTLANVGTPPAPLEELPAPDSATPLAAEPPAEPIDRPAPSLPEAPAEQEQPAEDPEDVSPPLPDSAQLSELPVVALLGRCLHRKVNGFVRIRSGQGGFGLIMRYGIPCYVEATVLERSFAAHLFHMQLISAALFQDYSKYWQQGIRLPPTGIARKANIQQKQLKELMASYVYSKISEILNFADGNMKYLRDDTIIKKWPPVDVNPIKSVLDHVQKNIEFQTLEQLFFREHAKTLQFSAESRHLHALIKPCLGSCDLKNALLTKPFTAIQFLDHCFPDQHQLGCQALYTLLLTEFLREVD